MQAIVEQTKGKAGRPFKVRHEAIAKDTAQAIGLSQVQWRELSLSLAARCQAHLKKGEAIPGQLLTQAAIAYDKAFAKSDPTEITLAIPQSLETALVKALVSDKGNYVNHIPQAIETAPVTGPCTNTDTVSGQAPVPEAEPVASADRGPGLQSDSSAGAGAASQTLSPVEPDIIQKNEKDQALVQARVKILGPKRFKNPFAGPDPSPTNVLDHVSKDEKN